VKPSLREILVDSHISAVALVVLLFWSLESIYHALWDPLFRAASFLITALAILDIPYFSSSPALTDRRMLIITFLNLFYAFLNLAAAWLLSRWVYGMGPLHSLSKYHARLARRNHV
jgi:hypothetical protein